MDRPVTTLFMLMSVAGKISTGSARIRRKRMEKKTDAVYQSM